MQTRLPRHTVVLLGIGHTNAHVLRMWKMKPIKDAQLICVSNKWKASYSGMLPGVLAGQYPEERMEIDLARLTVTCGARLVVGEATGIDLEKRWLLFDDRPEIPFDVLSIGIGSVPATGGIELNDSLLPIKPMQTFLPRLEASLQQLCDNIPDREIRLSVVGAGAGGTEIAFCLPARLRKWFPNRKFDVSLVTSNSNVASGCHDATVRLVEAELRSAGITAVCGKRVTRVANGTMTLDDGETRDIDLAIWATGATAPPLLSKLGLETDERGFLLTQPDLRVLGDHPIFAVGDTGTMRDSPTKKAGVFAVRQGPVLWRNIPRTLKKQKLETYQPQNDFLTLLNLGDNRAIAQYKGRAFRGKWCWKLKDYIDSKFMDKYQDYKPMEMKWEPPDEESQMRCTGCGGKVGGSVLSRVLRRLDVPQNEHVLVGLDAPDDAAVIQSPGGRPMTVTADFFTAPVDDPYIVGRVAALNSASDVFAIGAKPIAAIALVTVPLGSPRRQEQVLYETLAGSLHEFRRMGCSLAGGHTIEGPTLTVGYTVLADQGTVSPRTKGQLRPGDKLVLTKPLGSGILLAAHMQALCRGEWMQELLKAMLFSNEHPAAIAERHDISGLTDVTGFGFAGHLLEMLKAANARAEIQLDSVPLLSGTAEMVAAGIESTLAPANRDAESSISVNEQNRERPEYAALFDPQTCGGLLMGVSEQGAGALIAEMKSSGIPAAIVGHITEDGPERLRVV